MRLADSGRRTQAIKVLGIRVGVASVVGVEVLSRGILETESVILCLERRRFRRGLQCLGSLGTV